MDENNRVNIEGEKAIALQKEGRLREANAQFVSLAERFPEAASIQYYCASSFDALGEEAAAVPYYEKAIRLGVEGEELMGAYLGLGSTYRTLGHYEKSKETLQKGLERFPEYRALQVFYAMTLYNLGKYQEAMEIMLRCAAETSEDGGIRAYRKAISFYADKLDVIWK